MGRNFTACFLSMPTTLTTLAQSIAEAADREDWETVASSLNTFQIHASKRTYQVSDQADLQVSLQLIQSALTQASRRQNEIHALITGLSGKAPNSPA